MTFLKNIIYFLVGGTAISLVIVRVLDDQIKSAVSWTSSGESAGQMMRERAEHLVQECRRRQVKEFVPTRPVMVNRYTLSSPFPVCIPPKCGSTAWGFFMRQLRHIIPGSREHMKTLVVRHPFVRLASAYREKYLNGSPLNTRSKTGGRQPSQYVWVNYWIPALIHKRLITPSPKFLRRLEKTSKAFRFVAKKAGDTLDRFRVDTSLNVDSSHMTMRIKSVREKVNRGLQEELGAAVHAGYSEVQRSKLQESFNNASISLVEFLRYVLWTWDMGIEDRHWTPINELCDACGANYTYVLHMENREEPSYLFGLLQLQVTLPEVYKSRSLSTYQSDLRNFENLPRDLLARLVDMYELDFQLFGYDKQPFLV
ncbi:uncharacterized protein LOC121878796 [Homarus americanus]|uniref:Carbohydrate sulfotransferase n=1 Tax=Homarus americanus TaxID=6706 RepID=A0A8J5JLV4_HOMAM|nr:uncharacterized protein LOC121878796 [Homarus americanus]KAG7158411.1 Carbohydrate sulfotransferase 12-like [Homarus americanus]